MRWGDDYVKRHRLDSLRLLGSVGEPINPEAWMWYHTLIGKKRCPIVDTWWQTETGRIMVTRLPGVTPDQTRLLHIAVLRRRAEGPRRKGRRSAAQGRRQALPHAALALDAAHPLGRRRALQEAVLERIPGSISAGDGARRTRTATSGSSAASTMCSTSPATASAPPRSRARWCRIPSVAEAAVVGRPDELKGQALVVFVTLKAGIQASDELKEQLRAHVGKEIGSLAKPDDDVRFAAGLPKTRSGKIMRRILKELP
jgi:acetyl-CoA synthetase